MESLQLHLREEMLLKGLGKHGQLGVRVDQRLQIAALPRAIVKNRHHAARFAGRIGRSEEAREGGRRIGLERVREKKFAGIVSSKETRELRGVDVVDCVLSRTDVDHGKAKVGIVSRGGQCTEKVALTRTEKGVLD